MVEIVPLVMSDNRGLFFEEFHSGKFNKAGIEFSPVQSNQSYSKKGVIRGLHIQIRPHEQTKLVRVISGKVLDVAVDVRINSPTFGRHFKIVLDSKKNNMLFVPGGFAHGFAALEDTVFHYLCGHSYYPESETGIRWNDKEIAIDWEIIEPLVSEKDSILPNFKEFIKILQRI